MTTPRIGLLLGTRGMVMKAQREGAAPSAARIAVSPIVGGAALKGPAAKMMAELGEEVGNAGVARRYAGLIDALVIDEGDAAEASAVEALGVRARIAPTVMTSDADKIELAGRVLVFADEPREERR